MKQSVQWLLADGYFTGIMTTFTIYALFGDDLKVMSFPHDPDADMTFVTLSSIAFFLFLSELIMSCFAKDDYSPMPTLLWTEKKWLFGLHPLPYCKIGSFYFYLDVIATASLIFELPWLLKFPNDPTELELGDSDGLAGSADDTSPGADASALQSARAGRASRAGARAGRIVRIVRMVRLVRLVKLLKVKDSVSKDKVLPEESARGGSNFGEDLGAEGRTVSSLEQDDEDDLLDELLPESHVGKTMSDLTTRRVIVGVLSMLILLPLCTYTPTDESGMNQARLSHMMYVQRDLCSLNGTTTCGSYNQGWQDVNTVFKNKFAEEKAYLTSLNFQVRNSNGQYKTTDWLDKGGRENNMRYDAFQTIIVTSYTTVDGSNGTYIREYRTEANVDKSFAKSEEALLSFLLTIFVILLLGVGTMIFSSDTERLVINPIENMMRRVTEISENPLSTGSGVKMNAEQEGMETTFLLQTIDKIGNLMRIGFGEAGAEIIAANLKDSTEDRLNIDAILRGRPIHSIFGFCDIRNFTDTTECLQEEVMTFVNRVAHILHNIVKDCNGAANKNIGDAFLLSWKLPDHYEKQYCDLFDKALYAFLKFTVLLRRYDAFVTEFSAAATHRLYQRMPSYRCAMGMGLHVGEAVEGAIGTPQKIDATYISLHVNNSEFLESSTKTYKVPLLMSHFFYDRLSTAAKEKCRMVDVVKVTETLIFQLWTYDIDYEADYSFNAPPVGPKSPRAARKQQRQQELAIEAAKMDAEGRKDGGRVTKSDIQLVPGGKQKDDKDASMVASSGVGAREPVPEIVTFEYGATKYSTRLWNEDPDMRKLRHKMDSDELMSLWRNGIDMYVKGDWVASAQFFEQFQHIFEDLNDEKDGPAEHLLSFMKSQPGGVAPSDWDGSSG